MIKINKVKLYRKKHNLTQKDLSVLLGVTPDYVSQIERGRIPGMETAKKIAEIFGTTIDEIFFTNQQNIEFDNKTQTA